VKFAIEGAIFDLDGTLMLSMGYWQSLASDYIKNLDKKPKSDLDEVVKEMSLTESAEFIISEYNLNKTINDVLNDIESLSLSIYSQKCKLKKGVIELLAEFKKSNTKMCVLTASVKSNALIALERLEILKYFDFIVASDDIGIKKDNPEIFDFVIKKLKTSKEKTVVFDDMDYVIETAKNFGLKTVAVYDEYAEVIKCADFYINDFRDFSIERIYS